MLQQRFINKNTLAGYVTRTAAADWFTNAIVFYDYAERPGKFSPVAFLDHAPNSQTLYGLTAGKTYRVKDCIYMPLLAVGSGYNFAHPILVDGVAKLNFAGVSGIEYEPVYDFVATGATAVITYGENTVGSYKAQSAKDVDEVVVPPADVTGLTATPISATQIDLDWNDVLGAVDYLIEMATNSNFTVGVQYTSSTSDRPITGLTEKTPYYFRVLARNASGNSNNWAYANATTPETQSVLDEFFERFHLSEIFNINQLDLEMPVLRANFGDGYEAAALSGKPSGLRYWTISAEVLPDLDEYSVDYEVAGDDQTDSRFQYFWEFYRRHLSLGNKPFYFVDPRTNRKFLASFVDNRISFESITAKLYRGGVSIKQRRVKIPEITYRAADASVSN